MRRPNLGLEALNQRHNFPLEFFFCDRKIPRPPTASGCRRRRSCASRSTFVREKIMRYAKIQRHARRFRVQYAMRVFSLVLVGMVALAITAGPLPLLAAQAQYQQYPQYGTDGPDLRAAVEQIFALGNQARAQAGVAKLAWDSALASAALQHCRRMAAEGPISHRYGGEPDLTSRAAQAGAHFSVIEENVAVGPSPGAIHQAWMQSPGHRENLLSPEVDHVGIAVVYSRGVLYAVADFSAAVQNLSPVQVEARVAALIRVERRADSFRSHAGAIGLRQRRRSVAFSGRSSGVDDSLAELRSIASAAGSGESAAIGQVSPGRNW